jgi:hypothetical protein
MERGKLRRRWESYIETYFNLLKPDVRLSCIQILSSHLTEKIIYAHEKVKRPCSGEIIDIFCEIHKKLMTRKVMSV